jgi:hypothetical protein
VPNQSERPERDFAARFSGRAESDSDHGEPDSRKWDIHDAADAGGPELALEAGNCKRWRSNEIGRARARPGSEVKRRLDFV